MRPDHPLAADDDVPLAERAEAEAACAFALGRLDGLIAGLDDAETRLFCASVVRETLRSALSEAGLAELASCFDRWFAGIERAPPALDTPSPSEVVSRVLAELSRHRWQALADTAQTLAAAARFACTSSSIGGSDLAVERAELHLSAVGNAPLPFRPLERLMALLAADPLFAPLERAPRLLDLGTRSVVIEPAAARTPLWAVWLQLGRLTSSPLPFPGAITAECLQPWLWPNERATLAARALLNSVEVSIELIGEARRRAAIAARHLGHLRSSGRARALWNLLIGFAALGPDQIGTALSVSRRGTYAITDALVSAGMARRERVKGRVLLIGQERPGDASATQRRVDALPSPVLDEFDAAMADLDRLLARAGNRPGESRPAD